MGGKAIGEYLHIHPLKGPSKSSIVTSEADEVDANGCDSGGWRRRAMVANFCALPFGIRLPFPSRQPSFSSTPTAAVNSEGTRKTGGVLRGDEETFSNNSPKVREVVAAKWRFLPFLLLSDLFQTLISSFEATRTF